MSCITCVNVRPLAYAAPMDRINRWEAATQATEALLTQFEMLLEGVVAYQVQQGHFKTLYQLTPQEASVARRVKTRYEGQTVYSCVELRAVAVDTFGEFVSRVTNLKHALQTRRFDRMNAAFKALEAFVLEEPAHALVREYLDALPKPDGYFLEKKLTADHTQCQQAIQRLKQAYAWTPHALWARLSQGVSAGRRFFERLWEKAEPLRAQPTDARAPSKALSVAAAV